MRCTRCDGLAVPQAVGIAPDGRVVFGWCLQCLADSDCRLVEVPATGMIHLRHALPGSGQVGKAAHCEPRGQRGPVLLGRRRHRVLADELGPDLAGRRSLQRGSRHPGGQPPGKRHARNAEDWRRGYHLDGPGSHGGPVAGEMAFRLTSSGSRPVVLAAGRTGDPDLRLHRFSARAPARGSIEQWPGPGNRAVDTMAGAFHTGQDRSGRTSAFQKAGHGRGQVRSRSLATLVSTTVP